MAKTRPPIVDLFAGCGGFSLGAHLAGFRSLLAVDIDPTLTWSFSENFPAGELRLANLATVELEGWRRVAGVRRIAGVIGGPPCQGFSAIGARRARDPRNRLVWHFFRHVAALRPLFFVMENVPGFSLRGGRLLGRALDQLPSYYEVLQPTIVDAADYGAPTDRKRLLVIGYDRRYLDEPALPRSIANSARADVRAALADLTITRDPEVCERGFEWRKYGRPGRVAQYASRARRAPPSELGAAWAIERVLMQEWCRECRRPSTPQAFEDASPE